MPIIIFGGIYGGVFTPTEAGAVCVVYGIIAGWLFFKYIFREKWDTTFWDMCTYSAVNSATITIVIATAGVAGRIITLSGVPSEFTQFMLQLIDSKIVFLLAVNVLLLLLGMVMEPNTTILLLGPILAPAAQAYGVDVIHLGGIMVLNLGIGMITPPFAATLIVGSSIGGVRFDQIIRPVFPFFLVCIPVLLLTTFWPSMVLYLPNLF
jgi:C4-dicarboxylate transporter DctM subunit